MIGNKIPQIQKRIKDLKEVGNNEYQETLLIRECSKAPCLIFQGWNNSLEFDLYQITVVKARRHLQNWKHKKNDQLNEHWSYVCEHINLMITYWMPTMEYEKKCKIQKTWIQPTNQQRQVSIKKLEVWCSQGPWCLKHYYMVSWFLEFELGLTQFLKLAQLVRIVQAL